MQPKNILLYGANGYTGELIARYAAQYGVQPILAGRKRDAIVALAKELQLPYRIVELHDATALKAALEDITLVIQAAGPYHITARPMIDACIATQTHYIDLNGDLDVFEMLQGYDQAAKEKDVMILPGAGFDVVPTDCLALYLKQQLPDANQLSIAFAVIGSALSRGTSISTLHKLGTPGAIRKDGAITYESMGKKGMSVRFPGYRKPVFVMSIPWGDISTAWYSTRIPNIRTYTAINKGAWYFLKGQSLFNWLLKTPFMRSIIMGILKMQSAGPNQAVRDKATSYIRGKVSNASGQSAEAHMETPEAYSLTAFSVLVIAKKIINGEYKAGYQTPATAYGADLIMEIDGVKRTLLQ
ncbi:saccharopine dehydrogenase family protein [Chitinophaga rhizophila]|uniref:Saccharopine dehydrogenase NADP-binding domain-containing protein n=1 Tax=Chitinophaga rhizophila TaxID=2866212 RepID=A0ABS7GA37_9BACT|nr:saccharopine dehydrogenase NADP-binding domain-containing protein [Chitinophaga rhizophila]MBW8684522.1 saccharopine dehydrogenase NADP-binding domain-containing protein [Chitinophaga rhizophila]